MSFHTERQNVTINGRNTEMKDVRCFTTVLGQ